MADSDNANLISDELIDVQTSGVNSAQGYGADNANPPALYTELGAWVDEPQAPKTAEQLRRSCPNDFNDSYIETLHQKMESLQREIALLKREKDVLQTDLKEKSHSNVKGVELSAVGEKVQSHPTTQSELQQNFSGNFNQDVEESSAGSANNTMQHNNPHVQGTLCTDSHRAHVGVTQPITSTQNVFSNLEADSLRRERELLQREMDLIAREQLLRQSERNSSTTQNWNSSSVFYCSPNDFQNIIPDFDPAVKGGFSAQQWISKVDTLRQIYAWSDQYTLFVATTKLVGPAKSWYHGQQSVIITWTQLKTELLKSFPSLMDESEIHQLLLNRRKKSNECFEQYFFDMLAIAKRASFSSQAIIKYLIRGLDDENLKRIFSVQTFTSPEDLLRAYRSYEDNLNTAATAIVGKQDRGKMSQESSAPWYREQKERRKCFNCAEMGHLSVNCPKPQRRPRCEKCLKVGHKTEECNIQCTKCLKRGHLERDCKLVLNRVKKVTVSAQDEYHKEVVINGTSRLVALIDTGSEVSLISMDAAKACGLEIEPFYTTLEGFGNSRSLSKGRCTVNILIDDVHANIMILIVDNELINVPVLIGRDFIDNPQICLVKKNGESILFCSTEVKAKCNDNDEQFLINSNPSDNDSHEINEIESIAEKDIIDETSYKSVMVESRTVCKEANASENVSSNFVMSNSPLTNEIQAVTQTISDIVSAHITEDKQDESSPNEAVDYSTNLQGLRSNDDSTYSQNGHDLIQVSEVLHGSGLSETQIAKLVDLLNEFRQCFAKHMNELGCSRNTEMKIQLRDHKPICRRPYRLPYSQQDVMRNIVRELLDIGIIQLSSSSYSSPALLVKKKNGEWRMCVDYRDLNAITVKDRHPLPIIEDLLMSLRASKYYISLDLAAGYYQIPVASDSRKYTAFVTPEGQYEFCRMPFGLANGPSTFQRMMNRLAREMNPGDLVVYMDDALIGCKDFDDGLAKLRRLLNILRKEGLTLKLDKTFFFRTAIEFLGNEIDVHGIRPGKRKIEAVVNFKRPVNVHEVRQFLGLTNYFRKFMPRYAEIARPLFHLTRKDAEFLWNDNCEEAFKKLKKLLSSRPLLTLYDPARHHEVHTDASSTGIAGVLLQRDEDEELRPVAYFSRQNTTQEQSYHSYELEALAVVEAVTRFRTYLLGKHFKIITDCESLKATMAKKELIPRIARWWLKLLEFDFSIEYRQGERIKHVDALSRQPVDHYIDVDTVAAQVLRIGVNEEDWLYTVQCQDKGIREIVDTLKRKPNTASEKQIHHDYKLEKGRLYRVVNGELKWAVPKSARWRIVKSCHDDIGHFSIDRSLEQLKRYFWFPRMRNYVKGYISSCIACAYNKQPGGKCEGELHPIEKVAVPFHTLHLDHLGPFPKTSSGHTHILVFTDGFTKFTILRAVKNTSTKPVITILDEITSYFGVPTRIITDRGTAFSSHEFRTYCHENGIKHIMTATRTPRANGQVERSNRVILRALRTMTDEKTSWKQHLRYVQWGINSSTNATTKLTPQQLLFGFNPRNALTNKVVLALQDDHTVPGNTSLEELRTNAAKNIEKSQATQKDRFDRQHKRPKVYNVGDLVVVDRPAVSTGDSRKLDERYKGPYVVTAVLENDRYLVEDLPAAQRNQRKFSSVFATDNMKSWCSLFNPDSTDEEDDDDFSLEDEPSLQDGRAVNEIIDGGKDASNATPFHDS